MTSSKMKKEETSKKRDWRRDTFQKKIKLNHEKDFILSATSV